MTHSTAKELTDSALAQLAAQLEEGCSEALTAFLTAMSHMHHYSWNNTLLIAMQRPSSTYVAGFRTWKKLKRFVRKGEKGIAIVAPMLYRKRRDEEAELAGDDDDRTTRIRGFKVVYVFDIEQTDGEPLPEIHQISGDPGKYLDRMKEVVADEGIALEYRELGLGTFGCSLGGRICIKPGLSPAVEFTTLAHELAHEQLHRGERRTETTREIRELEAEAVSYVVTQACGLSSGTTSADYIKLYRGTPESLAESLEHIQKTACTILEAIRA
jgi:antirestriction protein ArdC